MSDSEPAETPAPPKKKASWGRRIVFVLLGIVVGLGIAELGFRAKSGGAFPHLNVYVADAELGVRLEPGASGAIRIADGDASTYRINGQGYRGADFPAKTSDDIIVIGDSQVFGLGVNEDQTLIAHLAKATGRPVINGGIPTYGPPEYQHVAEELLAGRKGGTLVYVVNIANDLFEANRPNLERHAVWDGWAVRKETAPLSTTSFPGRDWLYRRSHLALAVRRVWHQTKHPELDDASFPSEGGFGDLVNAGRRSIADEALHQKRVVVNAAMRPSEISHLEREVHRAQLRVEEALYAEIDGAGARSQELRAARATPGDIVSHGPGESGRPLSATAKQIRQGVAYRKKIEAQLRERNATETDPKKQAAIKRALNRRDEALKELDAKHRAPLVLARLFSPLTEPLEKLGQTCVKHGVTLVVLVLPLDVMVSADEWKKYEQEPQDMAGTEALVSEVVALAHGLGVRALDATAALKSELPGAFLGDLHLSSKGHKAVADALAVTLKEPAPQHRVRTLPPGRTRMPTLADFRGRNELLVHGSDDAGCETRSRREWVMVRCIQRGGPEYRITHDHYMAQTIPNNTPLGVKVLEGKTGDTFVSSHNNVVTLVTPIFEETHFVADFYWDDSRRRLEITWPKGEPVADAIHLTKQPDVGEAPKMANLSPWCACHKEQSGKDNCWGLLSAPDANCLATYKDQCHELLECSRGNPLIPPTCPRGQESGFTLGRCFKPCGDCKNGTCEPWLIGKLCVQ